MTVFESREIHLVSRPVGLPRLEDFELQVSSLESSGLEIIVKNEIMSVDPYMRGRMIDRPSYLPPFQLRSPMLGAAVGRVVESRSPDFAVGDVVTSMLGWREYAKGLPTDFQKVDASLGELSAFLNTLGTPGLTAYAGLFEAASLMEGEAVFVSAATGAVGSVACQLAKTKGCYVVGSAGSDEKCRWLTEVAGVDVAINYKRGALDCAVSDAFPSGIDVYFDNVGGAHLEAALAAMKPSGRIALCGMIEQYNDLTPRPGPSNLSVAIGKTLSLRGFLVSRYFHLFPKVRGELSQLVRDGRLKVSESFEHGIERAPQAFLNLFSGEKMGKMLVRL
jgi:NADPH-dependent curcumin reductase CurA